VREKRINEREIELGCKRLNKKGNVEMEEEIDITPLPLSSPYAELAAACLYSKTSFVQQFPRGGYSTYIITNLQNLNQ